MHETNNNAKIEIDLLPESSENTIPLLKLGTENAVRSASVDIKRQRNSEGLAYSRPMDERSKSMNEPKSLTNIVVSKLNRYGMR